MSTRRRKRELRICSRFDEESMSFANLGAAERLFAKLAVRMLLRDAEESESAGLRLHRRDGRELTPQESGPATSESELDHDHRGRSR